MGMNFHLEEALEMHYDGVTYAPSMAVLENTFGLSADRKATIAFTGLPPLRKGKKVELVFDDPFFGTGSNVFVFSAEDMLEVPGVVR